MLWHKARVAKPGQRRKVEGLVTQVFEGSNPFPRIASYKLLPRSLPIVLILNRFDILSEFFKSRIIPAKKSLWQEERGVIRPDAGLQLPFCSCPAMMGTVKLDIDRIGVLVMGGAEDLPFILPVKAGTDPDHCTR